MSRRKPLRIVAAQPGPAIPERRRVRPPQTVRQQVQMHMPARSCVELGSAVRDPAVGYPQQYFIPHGFQLERNVPGSVPVEGERPGRIDLDNPAFSRILMCFDAAARDIANRSTSRLTVFSFWKYPDASVDAWNRPRHGIRRSIGILLIQPVG